MTDRLATCFPSDNLDRLRLNNLYGEGTTSLFVGIIGAFLATIILWDDIPQLRLVAWIMVYLGLCGMRYVLGAIYLKASPSLVSISPWQTKFVVAQVSGALVWALAAILLFPIGTPFKQGFLSLLAVGIAIGTTHTCAAEKRAQLAFTVIVMPAFFLRNLYEGTPWNFMIAFFIGLAALFSLWWAHRARAILDTSLREKLERSKLLDSLFHERSRVEQLNEALESRIRGCVVLERQIAVSEARFRQAVENSPNAILTLDSEERITSWNPSCEKVLGHPSRDMEQMSFCGTILDSQHSHQFREVLKGVFRGDSVSGLELAFRCKDGTLRHMLSRAYPLTDSTGKVTECTLASTDITKQKESEEKIRSSLREKEVLLREIHHRVKNNLQVMASLLELQAIYLDDQRIKEACLNSQRRIWSMAQVHEALYCSVDFSHIRSGSYLDGLIQEIGNTVGPVHSKVKISTQIEDLLLTTDIAINCGLILNELVSNSFKHAFLDRDEGEVAISLSSSDDGYIELVISDNGNGISEEAQAAKGKTFGLDLVRMLITEMKGELSLISNGGTEFKMRWKQLEQETGAVPNV